MTALSGIYAIVAPSGRRYIGSAANIAARWHWHRNALTRGGHHNPALQAAFAKYGAALRYEVLEICEVSELICREQFHIDSYSFDALYNVAKQAGSPTRGTPHSAVTRAKIAAKATGRKHTAETLEKLRGKRPFSAANKAAAQARGVQRAGIPRTDLPIGKSGYRGVYKQARSGWFARVGVGATRRNIGTFKTPDLAYAMRLIWLSSEPVQ